MYIHEAHPSDGWQVPSNLRDGAQFAEPRALADRSSMAQLCVERLGLTTPLLLDGMDNAAARAYGAWPERLYVVSLEGRIMYRGGKGPYGFEPAELEAFLRNTLS